MVRILFICTGNTCRSPMAEGFMKKIASDLDIPVEVKSAGISPYEGDPVSKNAVIAAKELGSDISEHKAQPVTSQMIEEADMVLTMTSAHGERLKSMFPEAGSKIKTLSEKNIFDPFGGNLEVYRRAAAEIYRAVERLADSLKKNKG